MAFSEEGGQEEGKRREKPRYGGGEPEGDEREARRAREKGGADRGRRRDRVLMAKESWRVGVRRDSGG